MTIAANEPAERLRAWLRVHAHDPEEQVRLEALLRASLAEAASPAALDVQRLAEAMEACGLGLYHATEPRMLLEHSLPALAAEYARLTEQEERHG